MQYVVFFNPGAAFCVRLPNQSDPVLVGQQLGLRVAGTRDERKEGEALLLAVMPGPRFELDTRSLVPNFPKGVVLAAQLNAWPHLDVTQTTDADMAREMVEEGYIPVGWHAGGNTVSNGLSLGRTIAGEPLPVNRQARNYQGCASGLQRFVISESTPQVYAAIAQLLGCNLSEAHIDDLAGNGPMTRSIARLLKTASLLPSRFVSQFFYLSTITL